MLTETVGSIKKKKKKMYSENPKHFSKVTSHGETFTLKCTTAQRQVGTLWRKHENWKHRELLSNNFLEMACSYYVFMYIHRQVGTHLSKKTYIPCQYREWCNCFTYNNYVYLLHFLYKYISNDCPYYNFIFPLSQKNLLIGT